MFLCVYTCTSMTRLTKHIITRLRESVYAEIVILKWQMCK